MGRILRKDNQEFEIFEWHEDSPGKFLKFHDKFHAIGFLRGFLRNPFNIVLIREILTKWYSRSDLSGFSDYQAIELLALYLLTGHVKIVPGYVFPRLVPLYEEPEAEEEKTWIEIKLLDEADQPVVGELYEITLPDGTVEQGETDSEGSAKLSGIKPGTCQIAFPNLDKDAWEQI